MTSVKPHFSRVTQLGWGVCCIVLCGDMRCFFSVLRLTFSREHNNSFLRCALCVCTSPISFKTICFIMDFRCKHLSSAPYERVGALIRKLWLRGKYKWENYANTRPRNFCEKNKNKIKNSMRYLHTHLMKFKL